MAIDVSTIALAIDSTAAVKAKDDLNQLAPAMAAVEKSTDGVTAATGRMGDGMAVVSKTTVRARVDMSDAAQKYIDALQKEIDVFGKNRAESEKIEAAAMRFTRAEQDKVAALGAAIDALHREEDASKSAASQQDRHTASQEAFMARLREKVALQGLDAAATDRHHAAQLGLGDDASKLITQLEVGTAKMAAHKAETLAAAGATHEFGFHTAQSKRELLVLAHELSQGNFKKFGGSMMVLGEQTGAASLLFSGMGLAILSVVAVLGTLSYGVIKGAIEQEHFNKALVLTGNFAGQTNDSIQTLTKTLATSTHATVGAARGVAEALAATGEVGPRLIGPMADAMLRIQRLNGESTDKMVKDYAKLAEAPTKWAMEHNKASNDINVVQFETIRRLEELGQKEEAALVVMKAVSAHVSGDHAMAFGSLERAAHAAGESFSTFFDWMKSVGREATAQDRLRQINVELQGIQDKREMAAYAPNRNPMGGSAKAESDGAANETRLGLEREVVLREQAGKARKAYYDAESGEVQKRAIAASVQLKLLDDRARGVDKLKLALEKLAEQEAAEVGGQRDAGNKNYTISQAVHDKRVAEIERENKPRGIGRATLEDVDLERAKKAIAQEDALYKSRETMLALYFSTGLMDAAKYYAARQAAQDEHLEKTKTGYAKEIALIESRAGNAKTPDERIKFQKELVDATEKYNVALAAIAQTGAMDAITRIGKASQEAARLSDADASAVARQVEAAEKLVKADQAAFEQSGMTRREIEKQRIARLELTASHIEERIAVMAMMGFGVDQIAQQKILLDFARQGIALDRQKSESSNQLATGAQLALGKYREAAGDSAAYGEKMISGSFSRMEDAILNFAKTGKLSFSGLFSFMADEFLRQQIRMQLSSATTGGASGMGLLGSLMGAAGGMFGLGGVGMGTNLTGASLPTAGGRLLGGSVNEGQSYLVGEMGPEVLRMGSQGGAVTPNAATAGASAGSGAMHFDFSGQTINVGQGVSRSEMSAAVQQGNAASEARIRRLMKNGNV